MQAGNWFVKHPQVKDEANQLPQLHLIVYYLPSAHPQHQPHAKRSRKRHGRGVGRPDSHDCQCALSQIIRTLCKPCVFVVLASKSLDLADALEIIHERAFIALAASRWSL